MIKWFRRHRDMLRKKAGLEEKALAVELKLQASEQALRTLDLTHFSRELGRRASDVIGSHG